MITVWRMAFFPSLSTQILVDLLLRKFVLEVVAIHIMVRPARNFLFTQSLHLAEYLIKQYLQTGEPIYLEMWSQALAGIQKHMIISTKHSKLQFVAELPNGIGGRLSPKMDHL